MKAIFIDAKNRKVELVERDFENYKLISEQIGCDTFTYATSFNNGDVLYVDDEGLFDRELNSFFTYEGAHQPFAGNGLILGTGFEGDSTDAVTTLMEVASKVEFMTRSEAFMCATLMNQYSLN
jgi:hypothetical protein